MRTWLASFRWRAETGKERNMTKRRIAVTVVAVVCLLAAAAQAEVFVYPKKGQSQDQFQRDQGDCHAWAQNQTGVNPMQQQAVVAPPPQQGGAVRGAAGGAAVGAIGGAIGGNAGKGAAIGAGVGAVVGRSRQNRANRAQQDAVNQANAQQGANLQRYEQAYGTCMGGRGYQVS